jgi:hypothetical protein
MLVGIDQANTVVAAVDIIHLFVEILDLFFLINQYYITATLHNTFLDYFFRKKRLLKNKVRVANKPI